jgi:glycosyltransferase involved in cell wall biosynthesis
MKKTVIFDGQVFQTAAWDRGMGKYSLCMLEEMVRRWDKKQRAYLIFNSQYPLSDEALKAVDALLPGVKKVFLDLEIPTVQEHQFDTVEVLNKTSRNEEILSDFITSLKLPKTAPSPEFVILSLFLDEVCAAFPKNATNTLLCYDLIPLIFSDRYSRNENYSYYLARLPIILKADKLLAISQTVADDLAMYLGVAPERITNIQGAPVKRADVSSTVPEALPEGTRYILMTSGNDARKNNINAARGFEEYVASTGRMDLRLVITSNFDEYAQDEIEAFSDHLIFTGNVSEGELKWLYEHADAIMFVPEYEGLGLPILEAVEFAKPVVCSSIGAFREMSETAFYYADHQDPSDIAQALGRALSEDDWVRRQGEYPSILRRYTWRRTAQLALDVLEADAVPKPEVVKLKLAVLAPSPRGYSAIGKVVQQMHASLAEYFDVDYYLEKGLGNHDPFRQDFLEYATNVYDAVEFNADAYAKYDAVLYHIGNSEYHARTIQNALYLPGYVIIHDTKLPEIFKLINQLGLMRDDRYVAEGELDKRSGVKHTAYLSTIIGAQRGVIVHSEFARGAAQESASLTAMPVPIKKINLPTGSSKLGKVSRGGRLSVGMAGVIHEGKGLRLLEGLTAREEFGNITFSIFGVPVASEEVIKRLQDNERIHIATNLTDREFQDEITKLDILVNYREEYRGETSLSTIEAMRMGVVPIVRNVGWYAELPDTVAIKLDDSKDIDEVLSKVIRGEIDIASMSKKAMSYIATKHSYDAYSSQLHEFITQQAKADSQLTGYLKAGQVEDALRTLDANVPRM